MVADRIYTDVKTALNAGSMGVLVLSGETTLQTALESNTAPTITALSIKELGELLERAHQG